MMESRMRRLLPLLLSLLALMLCVVATPLQAQQKLDSSKFVIFIHAGPHLKNGEARSSRSPARCSTRDMS